MRFHSEAKKSRLRQNSFIVNDAACSSRGRPTYLYYQSHVIPQVLQRRFRFFDLSVLVYFLQTRLYHYFQCALRKCECFFILRSNKIFCRSTNDRLLQLLDFCCPKEVNFGVFWSLKCAYLDKSKSELTIYRHELGGKGQMSNTVNKVGVHHPIVRNGQDVKTFFRCPPRGDR